MNYEVKYQVYQNGKSVHKGVHTCWLEAVGDAQATLDNLELSELMDTNRLGPNQQAEVVAEEVLQKLHVWEKPMTPQEIVERWDEEDCYVEGIVKVEVHELVSHSYEEVLDLLSTRLVNSVLLMNIEYEVVGHSGSSVLLVKITGDASDIVRVDEVAKYE